MPVHFDRTVPEKDLFTVKFGTLMPKIGLVVKVPQDAALTELIMFETRVPCIQVLVDSTPVWTPITRFTRGNGEVNLLVRSTCETCRDIVELLMGKTIICKECVETLHPKLGRSKFTYSWDFVD